MAMTHGTGQSHAIEDYAKSIYSLQQRAGGEPVSTNALAEHLDVPWDRVHEEAEALEHVLSEDLEARIAAKLGNPTHDPHGDPIPDRDLVFEEGVTEALSKVAI